MSKIYFDERWPDGTGIGVVSHEFRSRLTAEWSLAPLGVDGKYAGPFSPWALASSLKRRASTGDIFWNPGFVPPASMVCTTVLHVHDLTHLHYYSSLHRIYYNLIYKRLYAKVDRIITGSEYSKIELCEWAKLPADKVDVIYNGVSAGFSPHGSRYEPGYDFIFYPGNYRTYKNLDRLLAAYAISDLPKNGVRLLMTGSGNLELKALAEKLKIDSLVIFVGRLSEVDLAAYYRSCKMICFPSLYEGFGLPIVEGMASGVPVLTSNVTSMPEVAGGAAYVVNPTSVEEISFAINSLYFDASLRQKLIELGSSRVAKFSWDVAAKKLSKVFREVQRG